MKEFREFLDPVNALGESSPGFIWRYTSEGTSGPANDERSQWPDDLIVVNMTVWRSLEDLESFTYRTVHSYFLRSRKKWFSQLGHPAVVLWNVPEGHIPTLREAREKLELLERNGVTAEAFTLARARDFVK